MPIEMPTKSRIKLPPIRFGEGESLGERIARLQQRGVTRQELAERIGTIQVLITDYERDRLRVTAEMLVRIAAALEMTTDELLGLKKVQPNRTVLASRRRSKVELERRHVAAHKEVQHVPNSALQ